MTFKRGQLHYRRTACLFISDHDVFGNKSSQLTRDQCGPPTTARPRAVSGETLTSRVGGIERLHLARFIVTPGKMARLA